MLSTVRAVVREGRIQLLEHVDLPEGASVLVTVVPDDEREFWLGVSEPAVAAVWDNAEDDVYASLLEK